MQRRVGGLAGDHAHVGLAVADGLHDVDAAVLFHAHADLGVAQPKARHVVGQKLAHRRRVGVQPHAAGSALRVVRQVGAHAVHVAQDLARMHGQRLARARGRDALRGAVEQPHAELALEDGQAPARGRQHHVALGGGLRQAAVLNGAQEQRQRIQVGSHRVLGRSGGHCRACALAPAWPKAFRRIDGGGDGSSGMRVSPSKRRSTFGPRCERIVAVSAATPARRFAGRPSTGATPAFHESYPESFLSWQPTNSPALRWTTNTRPPKAGST
ncbi:hypothetical protein FQZ97_586810 [compost metagenome]